LINPRCPQQAAHMLPSSSTRSSALREIFTCEYESFRYAKNGPVVGRFA